VKPDNFFWVPVKEAKLADLAGQIMQEGRREYAACGTLAYLLPEIMVVQDNPKVCSPLNHS
jgi:hypothetical protein